MKVQTEPLTTTRRDRCTPVGSDTLVCASAVLAALGLWSLWSQAFGVDLAVHRGAGTQQVGAVAVGATVVAVAAVLVLGLRQVRRHEAPAA